MVIKCLILLMFLMISISSVNCLVEEESENNDLSKLFDQFGELIKPHELFGKSEDNLSNDDDDEEEEEDDDGNDSVNNNNDDDDDEDEDEDEDDSDEHWFVKVGDPKRIERWLDRVAPKLIIPEHPDVPSDIDMSKAFELPKPSYEDYESAINMFAYKDSFPHNTRADVVGEEWFKRYGQCDVAAQIAMPALAMNKCNAQNQDELLEPMFQCHWHKEIVYLSHFLLDHCMNIANTTLKATSKKNIVLGLLDPRTYTTKEEYNNRRTLIAGIVNIHWWLGTIKFTIGKNIDDGWKHFGIARMLETTGPRLMGDNFITESWPHYCVEWKRLKPAFEKLKNSDNTIDHTPTVDHAYDEKFFKKFGLEIQNLALVIKKLEEIKFDRKIINRRRQLLDLILELREYECSDKFVNQELGARTDWFNKQHMMLPKETKVNDPFYKYHPINQKVPERVFGIMNFQYGTFFLYGFAALVEDVRVKPYFQSLRNSKNGLKFYHLGGNIGNEAFYASMAFDIPSVGIEIRPQLMDVAKEYQKKYGEGADLEFRCENALESNINDAGFVYMDSEIWDKHLVVAMNKKLLTELPQGAIVISPNGMDISDFPDWQYQGKNENAGVDGTSWETTIFYIYTHGPPRV